MGQLLLGDLYYNGRGVPQNDIEAVKWYRLAAEQDFELGQLLLGHMYNHGRGVPQNDISAYVWWAVASAQGNEVARSNIDSLAKQLTPEQLARAQEIAARCLESGYKDCY